MISICLRGLLFVLAALAGSAHAQDRPPARIVPQIGQQVGPWLTAATMSADGRLILVGSDFDTLKLWDARGGHLLRTMAIPHGQLSVVLSPDGRLFAVSDGKFENRVLSIWSTEHARRVARFAEVGADLSKAAFVPDGRRIVIGLDDGAVIVGSIDTGDMRTIGAPRSASDKGVKAVAVSPDGRHAAAGYDDGLLQVWSLASLELVWSNPAHASEVRSLAFSADGQRLASGSRDETAKLWSLDDKRLLHTFSETGNLPHVEIARSGRFILTISFDGVAKVWDTATYSLLRAFDWSDRGSVPYAVLAGDDRRLFISSGDFDGVQIRDLETGDLLSALRAPNTVVSALALSADGRRLAAGYEDGLVRLWSLTEGRLERDIAGNGKGIRSIGFSADSKAIAAGDWDYDFRSWDIDSGEQRPDAAAWACLGLSELDTRMISACGGKYELWSVRDDRLRRVLTGSGRFVDALAASKALPDFADAKFGVADSGVFAFTADRRLMVKAKHHSALIALVAELEVWDTRSGMKLRAMQAHESSIKAVAVAADASLAVSASGDMTAKLFDPRTGQVLGTLGEHTAWVTALALSADAQRLVTGSADATARVWRPQSQELEISLIAGDRGAWAAITRAGFFQASSPDAARLFSVVRGTEPVTIDQVWQSLYNPDLVRLALARDEDSREELKRAAAAANLDSVLDSGPAPTVVLAPLAEGPSTSRDVIAVEARITGREGKGVGRIEWRVNGVTAGVLQKPEGPGPEYEVARDVALIPGDNRVEVVAYNGANLLASVAAATTVKYVGPVDTAKPRLHVLAIGIDGYDDTRFRKLDFAQSDARAFAALMHRIGHDDNLYAGAPNVVLLPEAQATRAGIAQAIDAIAAAMHQRDTFILFAAAHGTSVNGSFFLIPYGFRSGEEALQRTAIGQTELQDWLANRIKAQRVLVLFDTCASGALVGGAERTRIGVPASDAAIGRLHEATGRPVLTAAATGRGAAEGFRGADGQIYGVFTYAVLEAFRKTAGIGAGDVDLVTLVGHVQRRVPEIAAAIGAEAGARGAMTRPAPATETKAPYAFRQAARFGSRGDNFVIGRRLD